jgi:hypothetical protein
VTTAGTLVTLLFAFAALSTTAGSAVTIGTEEHKWLAIALGLFVGAAGCALATNWPLKYSGPDTPKIRQLLEADSEDAPNDATRAVAETRAEILETAQSKNTIKERLIVAAIAPSHPVLTGHSIRPRRSACRESRRRVWMERGRMSSALSSEP